MVPVLRSGHMTMVSTTKNMDQCHQTLSLAKGGVWERDYNTVYNLRLFTHQIKHGEGLVSQGIEVMPLTNDVTTTRLGEPGLTPCHKLS